LNPQFTKICDRTLRVIGNLEITTGTGRKIAQVEKRFCAAAARPRTNRFVMAATKAPVLLILKA